MDELRALIDSVIQGRVDVREAEDRLSNILKHLLGQQAEPRAGAAVIRILDEVIQNHLIPEKEPSRAAVLARIAWRLAWAIESVRSIEIGLFAAFLLERLGAYDKALELVKLNRPGFPGGSIT
jgi:hypothetical protein